MSGEGPDSLVLVFLRRIDQRLDRVGGDIAELKMRLTSVENQLAALAATAASHYASLPLRMDRFEQRLERVERRLDLVEPTGR